MRIPFFLFFGPAYAYLVASTVLKQLLLTLISLLSSPMNAPNGSTNTTSPQPTQAQRELDQLWAKLEAKDLIPDGYGIRKREKKRVRSGHLELRAAQTTKTPSTSG
ncbi:hypothetical protein L227DRAFT_617561 [Lentinus tigrinus ALCF2SS1-6]|uniref:Uncharacterized protein n=1 Tax=Lentinus tigrinus ALCF2SS1-6 TaxID=1328759 RepID=A0A5C2RNS6_9APHY|nr:hypothetical protein L227DRAFT_617561 [Lentinus tigrinus ALCF2SS1-6]